MRVRFKQTVRHDVHELCQRAIDALRAVGFERVVVSAKSEAVYMRWRGRHGLLRIATHSSKRPPIGMDAVVSRLTFHGRAREGHTVLECSDQAIESMIWIAVGQYIMRSAEPVKSQYRGKKGTWEQARERELQ